MRERRRKVVSDREIAIKELISRVNSSLSYFEPGWVGCKRYPDSIDPEICLSFEQYIEARFNYECSRVPELEQIIKDTGGHLFVCKSIDDPDLMKRRFSYAYLEIVDPETLIDPDETLINELEKVKNFFGGSKIKFNNVKKKIKYFIEN